MMTDTNEKLARFVELLELNAVEEGIHMSPIENVGYFRTTDTHVKAPSYYEPGIVIVGQGEKRCYIGDQSFRYGNGHVLVLFMPMAMEVEILDASPERPFLGAGIRLEMGRLADVLLRIERAEGGSTKPVSTEPSGIFSVELNDHLLDPAIRLMEAMGNPRDALVLGDMIVDEIYYRLLCDERGGDPSDVSPAEGADPAHFQDGRLYSPEPGQASISGRAGRYGPSEPHNLLRKL